VYVHNNLCLFSRSTNDYVTRPCKMWDVMSMRHLMVAELTLNELELEVMMIEDEVASAGSTSAE
jgi:hypothetical protein